jgi:hypothetical protein
MPEVSSLVRKAVIEYAADNPGMSHSEIARRLEKDRPDLVDDLFADRRGYMLNQWVNQVVATFRADQLGKLKYGEIIAALSPDGEGYLTTLGEMTGLQAVDLGRRYVASGTRLVKLGDFYIRVGEEAGRRKVKNVFDEAQLEAMMEEATG